MGAASAVSQGLKLRGFKVWIEKGLYYVMDRATGEVRSRPLDRSPIERMFQRKSIDEDQLEAGLRFANAYELAGRLAKPAMVSADAVVATAGARRFYEMGAGRIDADAEVEAALRTVGKIGAFVVEWVVGRGLDVTELQQRLRWSGWVSNEQYLMGVLQGALAALAVFYQGRRPVEDEA